jgi:very-short-patch-repair endonuclease
MTARNDERPGTPWQHVYAIGHAALSAAGERRAAVLVCGRRALLSHRSAAGAWDIRPDGARRWDVSVRQASSVDPDAPVRVFRHPTLRDDEVTELDGIPITTVARTLLDLAAVVPAHHLRRAVERADQLELFDLRQVNATIAAHPKQPGRCRLLDLLADVHTHGITRTRSDVEAAFLQLCVDHGLPRPEVNQHEDSRERDFVFPAHRLVVEVDGWKFHRSRRSFTEDRRRDRDTLARGLRTARFTAEEIGRRPAAIAAELRVLLARR